jgi:hypothetical protein
MILDVRVKAGAHVNEFRLRTDLHDRERARDLLTCAVGSFGLAMAKLGLRSSLSRVRAVADFIRNNKFRSSRAQAQPNASLRLPTKLDSRNKT